MWLVFFHNFAMEKYFLRMKNGLLFLLLVCLGYGGFAQKTQYAPGKVTKGTHVSYKAFQMENIPFMLYVTNENCRDTAVFTMYYKDGRRVGSDEFVTASMDFAISDVRAAIHEVFSEDELRRYSASDPALVLSVTFDQEGCPLDIFFVFNYDTRRNRYDALLSVSPDKLYELEKRLKQIIKLKKDKYLAKYKNFKTIFTVKFFEEDE